MNILLARHGETPWNKEGRYQGHTDIPLSPEGEAQAARLGIRLSDIQIHKAVASPLLRARKTAELILGNRKHLLTFDDRLKEISHGQWEGKLASEIEISHPDMFHTWRHHVHANVPAGPEAETLGHVLHRSWNAFCAVTADLKSNETLLLVAHDAVNRVLLCKILGLPIERVWSFRQAPATLNVLSGETVESLQVVRLNDAEHVAKLFQENVHRAI
jgi:phosphoserine phosphatase